MVRAALYSVVQKQMVLADIMIGSLFMHPDGSGFSVRPIPYGSL